MASSWKPFYASLPLSYWYLQSHEFMFEPEMEWPADFRADFLRYRDAYIMEWKIRYRQLWQWDRIVCLAPEMAEAWPEWLKRKLRVAPLFLNQWILLRLYLEKQHKKAVSEFRFERYHGRVLPKWLRQALADRPDFLERTDLIATYLLPERRAPFSPDEPEAWPAWLTDIAIQDPAYIQEWKVEFDALSRLMKRAFDKVIPDEEPPFIWPDLHWPRARLHVGRSDPFDATTWPGYQPDNVKLHPDYEAAMNRAVAANKKRYRLLAAFGGFKLPLESWLLEELRTEPRLLEDLRAVVVRRWPEFKDFDFGSSEWKWGISRDKSADGTVTEIFKPRTEFSAEQGYFWPPQRTRRPTEWEEKEKAFFSRLDTKRGIRRRCSQEFMFRPQTEWPADFRAGFALDPDIYLAEWKLRYRQLWQLDRMVLLKPDQPAAWPGWLKCKLDLSPLYLNHWTMLIRCIEGFQEFWRKSFQAKLAAGGKLPLWLRTMLGEQPDFLDSLDGFPLHYLPRRRAEISPYEPESWPFWLKAVVAEDDAYVEEWKGEFDVLPWVMRRPHTTRVAEIFHVEDEDADAISVEFEKVAPPFLDVDLDRPYHPHSDPFDARTWMGYDVDHAKWHPDYQGAMERAVAANKKRYRLLAAFGGFHKPLERWLLEELEAKPTLLADLKALVLRRWPKMEACKPGIDGYIWGIYRDEGKGELHEHFVARCGIDAEHGYFSEPANSKIFL